jgi:hypothetical protein
VRFVKFKTLLVAMALLALCLLGGCSGAGMAPQALRNDSLQTLATDQMTMLVLLKGWLGVLYPAPTTPPGTPDIHFEYLADGVRVYGTDSYGHPVDMTFNNDGSGHGATVTPGGLPVTGTWDAPQGDPVAVQHIQYEYPDMRLQFTTTTDYGAARTPAPAIWEGTETLSDSRSLHFRFDDNATDLHKLRLQLPAAGLDLSCDVPVVLVVNVGWMPPTDSRADGTAAAASGNLTFALKRVSDAWQEMTLTSGPTSGTFSLGSGMSGSGRFMREGTLLGALNWPDTLVGRLDLTSMASAEVTPSATARALAISKWVSRLSELTPGSFQ